MCGRLDRRRERTLQRDIAQERAALPSGTDAWAQHPLACAADMGTAPILARKIVIPRW